MRAMTVILGTVVLICIVALGVAFHQNWIWVETSRSEDSAGETANLSVKIDTKKVKADLEKAKEESKDLTEQTKKGAAKVAEQVKEKAKELVGDTTFEGEITAIDPVQELLIMKAEEKTYTFRVSKDASISRGEQKVGLEDLQSGEKALVKFRDEEGQKVAYGITVHPKKG